MVEAFDYVFVADQFMKICLAYVLLSAIFYYVPAFGFSPNSSPPAKSKTAYRHAAYKLITIFFLSPINQGR